METKIIRDVQENTDDSESSPPFESEVNKALAAGFKPIGGVAIMRGAYVRAAQTLSKQSEDSVSNLEYKVITSIDYGGGFDRRVREATDEGWEPQGGVSYSDGDGDSVFAQAFVRERK